MSIIYLDNSATTAPCKAAVEQVNRALCENFANPSSLYGMGATAQMLLDDTRALAAKYLSCREDEIFFTSCGTESNNTALICGARSRKRRGNRIVSTAIEHPSVLNTLKFLQNEGFEVVLVQPEADGTVSADKLQNAITADTILVSVMLVNNETGAILPVEKIKGFVEEKNAPALIHCDASQAFGKMPISVSNLKVDMLTASGHKIHAPKGVGILYKSKKIHITPLLHGGGQEKNLRSGTEPTPAIAGLLGAMQELNVTKHSAAVKELCNYARATLSAINGVVINSPEGALPYILNISILGYRSETLLHFLEAKDIYVSSGSACSKGQKSHVLTAMQLDSKVYDSALRISFSRYNTKEDIDALAAAIHEIHAKLRRAN